MIERDLAHLRFINVRALKGETLTSEDVDFLIKMKTEIRGIMVGIDETLGIMIKQEEML